MALTQVKTSGIADDAVTLAKQAGGTDGNIISYDASGNPVAIATGSDGQVLTSTGAGSPPAFEALPTIPTVSGSTNNTVCTVTGANAIQGEAELTFDGAHLQQTITASNEGIKLTAAGNHYPAIFFDANRSAENNGIMWLDGKWNGTTVGALSVEAGDDTTNKDDGKITFYTAAGGSLTRKMAIEQDGNVHIDDGNLVVASGHGIDFSANTDEGSTSTATLFEDYEEGTFSPRLQGSTNGGTHYSTGYGQYTKIGNICHVMIRFNGVDLNDSAAGSVQLTGMPYTASDGGSTSTVAGITSNFELHNVTFHTDYKYSWYLTNNGTTWYGLRSRSGTTWQDWGIEDFRAASTYIDFQGSYRTT